MHAFYFSGPERPLFGAIHEPAPALAGSRVVVLCAPLWQEAVRAHRVLRQLSVRLAKAGFCTLRFDYYGAGDSAGDRHEGDVAQWLADIGAAVDEAKKVKGMTRVTLLGLRFGASLAALAAAARTDVDSLVLWEPVVDGKIYLEAGMGDHAAWRDNYLLWRMMSRTTTGDDGAEMLGFPITEAMRRSVSAVDLTLLLRTAPKVMMVERDALAVAESLKAHLATLGAQIDHEVVPEPAVWTPRPLEATASSRKTLDCIATWLGRSER